MEICFADDEATCPTNVGDHGSICDFWFERQDYATSGSYSAAYIDNVFDSNRITVCPFRG
jgi:hypothetical protein